MTGEPIDIAADLATWLQSQDHTATPTPLPDDFADRLPVTLITAIGGNRVWPVIDRHRVRIETYAEHIADAMSECRAVFATIYSINVTQPIIGGVQAYGTETGALPSESSDPNHQNLSVASFIAQINTRMQE